MFDFLSSEEIKLVLPTSNQIKQAINEGHYVCVSGHKNKQAGKKIIYVPGGTKKQQMDKENKYKLCIGLK